MDLVRLSQGTVLNICLHISIEAVCFVQQAAKPFKGLINAFAKATSAGLVRLQWTPDMALKTRMDRLTFESQADKFWKVFEINLQRLHRRLGAGGGATLQTILLEIARNSWFSNCGWLQDEAIVKALAQQTLKKLRDSAQYSDSLKNVIDAMQDRGDYCCLDVVVPVEHVSNLMLSIDIYRNYALFDDELHGSSDDEHDGSNDDEHDGSSTILHLIALCVIFSCAVIALGAKGFRPPGLPNSEKRSFAIKFAVAAYGLAVPDFGEGRGDVPEAPEDEKPSGS